MAKNAKIKVNKDGPYLVTGGVPLLRMIIEPDSYGDPCIWRLVHRYPLLERYALCRCGKSRNKPYCDGAHIKQRFKGTETASRERYLENVKEYLGPELKLTDKPELCVSAGFCDRYAGIWNLTVHSDRPGFKEIAIEEAANCPSGRLVVWDKQGNRIEPAYEPSIVVTEDMDGSPGPLWIRGEVEIESSDGSIYEKRNRVTLCKCGKSPNKPLCDGSHFET
jgi:CDGSH-type Zn-finger protein